MRVNSRNNVEKVLVDLSTKRVFLTDWMIDLLRLFGSSLVAEQRGGNNKLYMAFKLYGKCFRSKWFYYIKKRIYNLTVLNHNLKYTFSLIIVIFIFSNHTCNSTLSKKKQVFTFYTLY